MKKILWIDDSADHILSGLGTCIKQSNFDVEIATNYQDGKALLERNRRSIEISSNKDQLSIYPSKAEGKNPGERPGIMIDVVIPYSDYGSLDNALGIKLAERAIEKGYRVLLFYTVVSRWRVEEKLESIIKLNNDLRVGYIEKTELEADETVDRIVEFFRESSVRES